MSSHRAVAAKGTHDRKPPVRAVAEAADPAVVGVNTSDEARRLAAGIERALAQGRRDILTTAALQDLVAATCKLYAAKIEAGEPILPCSAQHGVSATDVMTTASGLLRSVNLAVFELGMWQSWTGR
jgi:hypothetical protein